MAEYTGPQTLKDALIAEGNQQQADLLTEETASLTRNDLIGFINNASLGNLSDAGKSNLRKISVMRIKSGQPVFPWNDEEFLNSIYNDISQFVY